MSSATYACIIQINRVKKLFTGLSISGIICLFFPLQFASVVISQETGFKELNFHKSWVVLW